VSPSSEFEVGEEGWTERCEPSLNAEGADILSDGEEDDCSWRKLVPVFQSIDGVTHRCDYGYGWYK